MANEAVIWFPYHIKDFRSETYKMTHEEKGVYLTLIESIWEADGAIPGDDKSLAAELGLKAKEWTALKHRILRHFELTDDGLSHPRLTTELVKAKANVEQKRRAGIASAAARSGNARSTGVQRTFNARTNGEATEAQRNGNGSATAGQPYAGGGGGGGGGPSFVPRIDLSDREGGDAPFKIVGGGK